MTTNAGAAEMDSGSIGIHKKTAENGHKRDKVIKNFFSPEFRNRLDAIIKFKNLDQEVIEKIVETVSYTHLNMPTKA